MVSRAIFHCLGYIYRDMQIILTKFDIMEIIGMFDMFIFDEKEST